MEHHFNVEIAFLYGVNEAIFVHNLYFWVRKNEANGRHFYENKTWTYNSTKALCKLFPYWSPRQMETIIRKCKEKGLIYTGNFNKSTYDRTTWYALSRNVKCIYAKCEMDSTEMRNAFTQSVEPIPDNKPDNKPDSKHIPPISPPIDKLFEEFYKKYPLKKNKKSAYLKFKAAFKGIKDEALVNAKFSEIMTGLENYIQELKKKNIKAEFIAHPTTWLNGERWQDEINIQNEGVVDSLVELFNKYKKEEEGC